MNRWLLLGGGFAVSLLVTALLWILGVPGFFLFLFFPFFLLPFGRGRRPVRHCPGCGFQTGDRGARYCPRDGRELH